MRVHPEREVWHAGQLAAARERGGMTRVRVGEKAACPLQGGTMVGQLVYQQAATLVSCVRMSHMQGQHMRSNRQELCLSARRLIASLSQVRVSPVPLNSHFSPFAPPPVSGQRPGEDRGVLGPWRCRSGRGGCMLISACTTAAAACCCCCCCCRHWWPLQRAGVESLPFSARVLCLWPGHSAAAALPCARLPLLRAVTPSHACALPNAHDTAC